VDTLVLAVLLCCSRSRADKERRRSPLPLDRHVVALSAYATCSLRSEETSHPAARLRAHAAEVRWGNETVPYLYLSYLWQRKG